MSKRIRSKSEYFTREMFFKSFPALLVSSIGKAVGSVADAVCVGVKMGVTGLAAVGMAMPLVMVLNVIMEGFGSGGAIIYARLMAGGSRDEAKRNFNAVIRTGAVIGILIAILGNVFIDGIAVILGASRESGVLFEALKGYSRTLLTGAPIIILSYILNYYLRADGLEKLAAVGFTVANVFDFCCNVFFVIFLNMGASGAALSTVLGCAVALIIYSVGAAVRGGSGLRLCGGIIRDKCRMRTFRLGFSSSVQYIFMMVFILTANRILLNLGGDSAVAIFDLIQNASFIILPLYEAAANSAQPIVSTYRGERNSEGVKKIFALSLASAVVVGGTVAALLAVFPRLMTLLFGVDGSLVDIAHYALRVYFLSTIFGGINLLIQLSAQACENEKIAFLIATLRGAAYTLPLLWILSRFRLNAIWWMYPAAEVMTLITALIIAKIDSRKAKVTEPVYGSTINGTVADLDALNDGIEEFCSTNGASMKQIYFVRMCVEEICVEIMKHQDDNGFIQITVVKNSGGDFELFIRDNASQFNLVEYQTKAVEESGAGLDTVGIHVIKDRSKEMQYRRYKGFNTLLIRI